MNERILKLAEQADGQFYEGFAGSTNFVKFAEDDLQKFAELIVKECMDLASAEQKRYANITHRDMSECAVALGNFSLLLKDHFEGEE